MAREAVLAGRFLLAVFENVRGWFFILSVYTRCDGFWVLMGRVVSGSSGGNGWSRESESPSTDR